MRRRLPEFGALLLYLVTSLACFGRGVVRDPTGTVVGHYGSDQGFFMWSLVHWLHVLQGRERPFLTDLIYYPDGFNLAWATVIPGPALVVSPVTWLFGPEPAYNLLALLAPALAAWCAFLLCRELTQRFWPALVGGAVFGFSSYLTAQTLNHLNLALVFPLPLAALVVVRHVRGHTSDRRLVIGIAAVLVGQFLIFTEMLLGLVFFGGIAGLIAIAVAPPDLRARLVRSGVLVALGGAIAAVIVAPYLIVAFMHPNPIHEGLRPDIYSADAANVFFPTSVTNFGGHAYLARSLRFTGNLTEQLAYVPLPLIALLVGFVVLRARSFAGRFLPLAMAVPLVCALGPHLIWEGHPHWRLPWHWIGRLPVLHLALPTRFMAPFWLGLAVVVALALTAAPRLARPAWVLAVAGLVLLVPKLDSALWSHPLDPPAFFVNGQAKRTLGTDAVVVILPYGFLANGMYWQAKADMVFNQAGGYASSVVPDTYRRYPVVTQFYLLGPTPDWDIASFRQLLRDKRVTDVLVDARLRFRYQSLLTRTGLIGREIDGVVVYPVPARLRG